MIEHNKYYIIAETAFSHEGDFNYLIRQIDEARKAKADIIKFQILLDPGNYYCENSHIVATQKMIFTEEQWFAAFKYAKQKKLKVLALPSTVQSMNFLIEKQNIIDFFEIHSANFLELPLINLFARLNKTNILLGIGGRLLNEVHLVVKKLKKHNIILMHGFQSFPTIPEKVNLGKIATLREKFKISTGYADHTAYNSNYFLTLSKYAFILGCRYFELHIVKKKGEKRIDYISGHTKNDFIKLKEELNSLVNILGEVQIDNMNDVEHLYRKRQKSIVTKTNLKPGKRITLINIDFRKKSENQEHFLMDISQILGKKITVEKRKHDFFYREDFDE